MENLLTHYKTTLNLMKALQKTAANPEKSAYFHGQISVMQAVVSDLEKLTNS